MILPKGVLQGIYRGRPSDFLERVRDGYLKVSWKDSGEIYLATVLLRDGNPVMAHVERVKERRDVRGKEAYDLIRSVDYGVVEVYSLSRKDVDYSILINDESYLLGERVGSVGVGKTEKREEKEEAKEEVKEREEGKVERSEEIKVDDFEEYVTGLKGFSGLVKGVGEDRVAEVYLKEGEIVGAVVKTDNDVYEGLSALYYLDFPAKVYVRKGDFNIDDSIKVDLKRTKEEIVKKYKIRVPDEGEIDEVLKSLYEMGDENRGRFRKLLKFFKR